MRKFPKDGPFEVKALSIFQQSLSITILIEHVIIIIKIMVFGCVGGTVIILLTKIFSL